MPSNQNNRFSYQTLVNIATGFFIAFGLGLFLITLIKDKRIDSMALLMVLVFAAQHYFKHLLTYLILGIVTMFMSIFMLLGWLNWFLVLVKAHKLTPTDAYLLFLPLTCLTFSGILVFSFQKLNFKE